MMKGKTIDDYFGSYLKTEDIGAGKEASATIKEVKVETLGREENAQEKLVVYFSEFEKGLALNKVNSEAIAEITGTREYANWAGEVCTLYIDPNVMFAGKRVGGIRIKAAPKDGNIKADKNVPSV